MSFGTEQFRVLPEHVKLLSSACVGWNDCEYGAPSVDSKRPYGNSDVMGDLAELLQFPPDKEGRPDDNFTSQESVYDYYKDETMDRMDALHRETQTALEVFLNTGAMQPGLYEREKYRGPWKRVGA